ncbi:hypothetical protein N0V85_006696 [Neurospora sp. IMI 360204]|nr:hypothetical protein N0V85_006696 [Neurospora sp. IMI 360204]
MDFSANLQGLCPVHFPVNADDMAFLNNESDEVQWGGLDLEQAPDQLVCLCPELMLWMPMLTLMLVSQYPGDDDVDLDNAGDMEVAVDEPTAQHLLAQSTPIAGATSNNHSSPRSREASGSASADPAASHTPSPKVFTCDHCGSISAKTPRDFDRHLATKKHFKNVSRNGPAEMQLESLPNCSTGFRCPVASCDKTFPRKDNLWRHIANMHGISGREA